MTCECQRVRRHLDLIRDAVDAVHEAERLLPGDETLREEERLLLDLEAARYWLENSEPLALFAATPPPPGGAPQAGDASDVG